MDLKNMGALVAGLVVSVLLLAAVLIPVVNSAADAADTVSFTNEGTSMTVIEDTTTEYTMTWTGTTVKINDTTYTNGGTYIYSDEFKLIAGSNYANGELYTNDVVGSYISKIVFSEGTATFTYGESSNLSGTVTAEYTWFAFTDNAGDYVFSTNGAYLDDGKYYGFQPQGIVTANSFSSTCTITDREVTSANGATRASSVLTDVSSSVTGSATTTDYFTTVKTTYDETDYTMSIIAPATVSYVEEGSSTIGSLLTIMPLLVTVGIIIGIVGMMFNRRE